MEITYDRAVEFADGAVGGIQNRLEKTVSLAGVRNRFTSMGPSTPPHARP